MRGGRKAFLGMLLGALVLAGVAWAAARMAHRALDTLRYGSDGPHSGWCAQWLGDVDGDGVSDFVLGTPFERRESAHFGRVRVVSGASGHTLRELPGANLHSPTWRVCGDAGDIDDGALLREIEGLAVMPGTADYDRDGCADLIGTRNVHVKEGHTPPDDLWLQGRVEIHSGRTGEVLRTFGAEIVR